MGAGRQDRPKSLILITLWQDHRAALQYDWMQIWHQPLDPKTTPLNIAWPMCREILKNRRSHSFAALAGWAYVPDDTDKLVQSINQGQSKLNLTPDWAKPDTLLSEPTPPKHRHDHRRRALLNRRLGLPEDYMNEE